MTVYIKKKKNVYVYIKIKICGMKNNKNHKNNLF